MAILTTATIRGKTYNQWDGFWCQAAVVGNAASDGTGATIATLSVGDHCRFVRYNDAGVPYPYCVATHNDTYSESDVIGWFTEEVFPYGYYTITYDANGGSGAPESQTKTAGTDITLRTETPTREGYAFKGWRAVLDPDDETRVDYQPGGTYSTDSNVTMFAIWELVTYSVTYSSSYSGVTNLPASTTKEYGVDLVLSETEPSRENYHFLGWATSLTDSQNGIVTYNPGDIYSENAALTLYAVWKPIYVEPTISNFTVVRCNDQGKESLVGTWVKLSFDWTTDSQLTLASGKIDYAAWGQATTLSLDKVNSSSGTVTKTLQGGAYRLQDNNFKVTITDSFGSSTSASFELPAIDYTYPVISDIVAVRANSTGNEDENGAYGKVTFNWAIDVLEDNSNSVSSITVGCREYGTNLDYTDMLDVEYDNSLASGAATAFSSSILLEFSRSYEFKIVVTDQVTATTKYAMITYGFETMNIMAGGRGVAIGKKATELNLLDIAMDAEFRADVTIGGRKYGENQILWSGASHMNANQTVTLSGNVSDQPNGIVLVFSGYDNSSATAKDVSINTFFVSKKDIELFPYAEKDGTGGHTFILGINAGFSGMAAKYLYFTDNMIYGHEGNTSASANSGITFDNSKYVLRYVIGV